MLSQSEHDQLIANYKLASANLASAERKLSYTKLLAPFAGTVSNVDKQRFENATPGETLLSLYQNDKVYVRIQVSDSILASISPNMRSNSYGPKATFGGHNCPHQDAPILGSTGYTQEKNRVKRLVYG